MNNSPETSFASSLEVELYVAVPDALYSLDATAHLAGVSRRLILIYSRAGIVRPVFQPPYGIMTFAEEAIYTIRRFEDLRSTHDNDVVWIKTVCDLLNEVEHLQAEVRFLRKH